MRLSEMQAKLIAQMQRGWSLEQAPFGRYLLYAPPAKPNELFVGRYVSYRTVESLQAHGLLEKSGTRFVSDALYTTYRLTLEGGRQL